MTTLGLIILASLGAGGAALGFVKWRSAVEGRENSARTSLQRRSSSPGKSARYACVRIKLTSESCQAAKALAGKVLLTRHAPALPLEGCRKQCKCSFIKLPDRRQDRRRWADEGIAPMVYGADERRKSDNRRKH